MSDKQNQTTVKTAEVDINTLLGTGADSVMMPGENDKKPSIFSPVSPDVSFLDMPSKSANEPTVDVDSKDSETDVDSEETTDSETTESDNTEERSLEDKTSDDDPLAPPVDILEDSDEDSKNKGGRPTNIIAVTKTLIEKGIIKPFSDGLKIEEYTQADFEELYELNLNEQEKKVQSEMPERFFSGMPTEMQQAWQYIADGGQDLKGLFQAMASTQEVKDVDTSTESGQIYAIRTYLQATNYGTADEIEDEINSLHDRGELEKKANQFKPKLDAMHQQIVNQRVAVQQQENAQRQQQSQIYMDNVYNTLEKGDLNGIKLDNKIQNMLYAGLVQPNYPSASGRQTNLLGHLLEKYQWVEPDHGRIAEALWLLADPKSYKDEIRSQGESDANAKTVRTLKTEQSASHSSSSQVSDEDASASRPKREGLQRPKRNFFGR